MLASDPDCIGIKLVDQNSNQIKNNNTGCKLVFVLQSIGKDTIVAQTDRFLLESSMPLVGRLSYFCNVNDFQKSKALFGFRNLVAQWRLNHLDDADNDHQLADIEKIISYKCRHELDEFRKVLNKENASWPEIRNAMENWYNKLNSLIQEYTSDSLTEYTNALKHFLNAVNSLQGNSNDSAINDIYDMNDNLNNLESKLCGSQTTDSEDLILDQQFGNLKQWIQDLSTIENQFSKIYSNSDETNEFRKKIDGLTNTLNTKLQQFINLIMDLSQDAQKIVENIQKFKNYIINSRDIEDPEKLNLLANILESLKTVNQSKMSDSQISSLQYDILIAMNAVISTSGSLKTDNKISHLTNILEQLKKIASNKIPKNEICDLEYKILYNITNVIKDTTITNDDSLSIIIDTVNRQIIDLLSTSNSATPYTIQSKLAIFKSLLETLISQDDNKQLQLLKDISTQYLRQPTLFSNNQTRIDNLTCLVLALHKNGGINSIDFKSFIKDDDLLTIYKKLIELKEVDSLSASLKEAIQIYNCSADDIDGLMTAIEPSVVDILSKRFGESMTEPGKLLNKFQESENKPLMNVYIKHKLPDIKGAIEQFTSAEDISTIPDLNKTTLGNALLHLRVFRMLQNSTDSIDPNFKSQIDALWQSLFNETSMKYLPSQLEKDQWKTIFKNQDMLSRQLEELQLLRDNYIDIKQECASLPNIDSFKYPSTQVINCYDVANSYKKCQKLQQKLEQLQLACINTEKWSQTLTAHMEEIVKIAKEELIKIQQEVDGVTIDVNVTEYQLDQLNSKLETYKSYLSELRSILGDKNDQLKIIEDMIDCKITQIVDAQIKQQNNGTFRDALKENTKKLGADIKQQGRRIVDKLNKFAFGK